jgi:hypothetical protein
MSAPVMDGHQNGKKTDCGNFAPDFLTFSHFSDFAARGGSSVLSFIFRFRSRFESLCENSEIYHDIWAHSLNDRRENS